MKMTFDRTSHRFGLLLAICCTAMCGVLGCGDDKPDVVDDGRAVLTGRAFVPEQVAPGKIVADNAQVQVIDFQRTALGEVTGTGITDDQGVYAVDIPSSRIVAVVVRGPVRISGLTTARSSDLLGRDVLVKNFDGVTDVACEAGVTALGDGSLQPEDFNQERIANLEAGSAVVNATTAINFFDPSSVTAAASLVRQITGDGSFSPQ